MVDGCHWMMLIDGVVIVEIHRVMGSVSCRKKINLLLCLS